VNGQIAAWLLIALTLGTVLGITRMVISKRRQIVTDTSAALATLNSLNQKYRQRLVYPGPIVYTWEDTVNSKGKFDRYDLNKLLLAKMATLDDQISNQIAAQLNAISVFIEYTTVLEKVALTKLGRSSQEKMNPGTFARIEKKLFTKQILRAPACSAQVRGVVRYTSPKGQNSYVKELNWNFEQLTNGLAHMKQIKDAQSTAVFLRQQERNRMSANIRYQVLTRDNSRCQQCGASARNGASLHVDHIVPVSKGGTTDLNNLQTLCETCNLGKSNRH